MYMKKTATKKSILLLLIMNFVLIVSLLTAPTVKADQENIKTSSTTLINNDKVVSLKLENVDYNDIKERIKFRKEEVAFSEVQRKVNEKLELERLRKTVASSRQTNYSSINVYTDLSVMNTVTTDQLNKILDYWDSECGGTPFKGKGQMFIDASKESGLDPIYILAHAALESGWGKSQIARDKHNYFGIAAYDSSPYESAKNMGNGLYEGIVEGAKWIDRNYYDAGQTSLYSMRYNNGHHEYCTSKTWMYKISNIMQDSYKLIQ